MGDGGMAGLWAPGREAADQQGRTSCLPGDSLIYPHRRISLGESQETDGQGGRSVGGHLCKHQLVSVPGWLKHYLS